MVWFYVTGGAGAHLSVCTADQSALAGRRAAAGGTAAALHPLAVSMLNALWPQCHLPVPALRFLSFACLVTKTHAPSAGSPLALWQNPLHASYCRCVSPDAPTNPVLYYLGRYDPAETEFILDGAKGPIRLDLGDILYAPNIQTDAEVGSNVMAALNVIAPAHAS